MPPIYSSGKKEETTQPKIAINLWDLDRLPEYLKYNVLQDKLDTRKEAIVRVDKSREDETAIPFKCDDLTAALCIDVVRNEQRIKGEPPIRAYIHRRAWSRLSGSQVLTIMGEGGKAMLDPDLFALEEELAPLAPPPIEKIILGKRG